jgi:hypothetical protein
MRTMPKRVWILPPTGVPQKVPEEQLPEIFDRYDDTGWEPKLEFLYTHVGEPVDMRRIPGLGDLWLDDEGLFRKEPRANIVATHLYQQHYLAGAQGHPVVGTVVMVVHPDTPEGADEEAIRRAYGGERTG